MWVSLDLCASVVVKLFDVKLQMASNSARQRRRRAAARGDGTAEQRVRVEALRASGLPDTSIFGHLTSETLRRKETWHAGRCRRCWHDAAQRCICPHLPYRSCTINVRILVVMHSSEYLAPGDDAKLLLAVLPLGLIYLQCLFGDCALAKRCILALWRLPQAILI